MAPGLQKIPIPRGLKTWASVKAFLEYTGPWSSVLFQIWIFLNLEAWQTVGKTYYRKKTLDILTADTECQRLWKAENMKVQKVKLLPQVLHVLQAKNGNMIMKLNSAKKYRFFFIYKTSGSTAFQFLRDVPYVMLKKHKNRFLLLLFKPERVVLRCRNITPSSSYYLRQIQSFILAVHCSKSPESISI